MRGEHLVERSGLRLVAGEPVEHEPAQRVGVRKALLDQLDRDLVWDERTARQDRLHTAPELGSGGDRLTEHVAGRDVRYRIVGCDPFRLRALPRPLRSQHEQVQRKKPSYDRIIICDSIWRMVSRATPTTISTEVPPRAREVACEKLNSLMKIDGSTATEARKIEPGRVNRVSTRSR